MTTNESKLDAVKKEIRSVLISSKNGLSLKEFSNEYKSLLGKTLPFKEFGYNTYIDFLQDLTDVVHVQVEKGGSFQLYGIADDATQHIQKLVSRQRSNPKKKTEKVTRLNRNISQTSEPRGKPFVPALLRGELLLLLKNHPNGIGYSSLVTEYRKIFGKEITLGWLSQDQNERFIKLAEAIPEIELKTFYGQLKLFHKDVHRNQVKHEPRSASNSLPQQMTVSNCYADKSVKVDEKYLYSSAIPESVKMNFEKVLKLYPEGILAVHFPIAYEMITKETLDIFSLSYTSLLEIADALPDIFYYYKNPAKNNEWIFRHADFCNKASTPTNSKSNGHAHKSVPRKFHSSNNVQEDLDIANHCLPYNIEELPSDGFTIFFPVFISAVDSPGLFWIHLHAEETYTKFNKLEKEMNDFYDDRSYKYKMKDAHIMVGASCVVFSKSDDLWYRAEILSIPSIEYVNVTYVDYGGSENIEKYNLYYLKNEFKSFPRYAHKASLGGVVPANQTQRWDEKAKDVFLRLASRILMAQIHSKDEDILSLILCDVGKGKSIFVNDTLQQEGFAEFCNSDDEICNGSKDLSTDLQGEEVASSNHFPHNQTNGKIASEEAPLRNGIKMPNGHMNRLFNRQPALKESNKRYVKRVCLDEGYRIHLIVVADKAYVSGGDLCNLFWTGKPADVLALKLKFKRVSVPTISVSEEDNSKLFHQCKKYSVKGFLDAVGGSKVELYPLDCVMKILNTFGHPSAQIRETLVQEISNLDLHSAIWKEYQDPEEDNLDKSFVDTTWSNLCLYDLTALHTGLEYQRLKLMNESNGNIYNSAEIKKIESKQNNTKKRMDEILLICSQYAS